jgi:hypothetical protein
LCGDIYLNLQIYIEYFYYTVMLMQIHEKEINQEQEEIYRNIMDRSMTWSRSVVFSWYSGYLHDITSHLNFNIEYNGDQVIRVPEKYRLSIY